MQFVDGICDTTDKRVRQCLNNIGIIEEELNGIWYINNGVVMWNSGADNGELYLSTESHDFHLNRADDGNGVCVNKIIIDKIQFTKVANGVNIVIYDTMTEKVADCIGLNADDGYGIVR